jgi:hypothetical protein
MLSPLQLDKLANEWQLDYELKEGDLISRKGRATNLSRGIVIARTSKGALPSSKRRQEACEQNPTGIGLIIPSESVQS